MAKLIANTKGMIELEWLQLRKKGIGGSDASAILGVSKYTSPLMVYMDKLDLHSEEKSERVRESAHFGHVLEPVVRNEFVRRINLEWANDEKPIKVQHRKAIYAHNKYDWMRTNLDGIVSHPELGKGVFEAKTSHYMLRDDWEGENVPDAYYIQCQHNMAVMGYKYAYLAVLIGGNTYKHYYIERDEEFINMMIDIEKAFWENNVLQRNPPLVSGLQAEKDFLTGMYPESKIGTEIVNLPLSTEPIIYDILAIKDVIKSLEARQIELENEVKLRMGDTEMAFVGPHKVSWKTAANGQRRFNIKYDAIKDKETYYKKHSKDAEKELKDTQNELKEYQKELKRIQKEQENARKEHEKQLKEQLKETKKQIKEMEAELNG